MPLGLGNGVQPAGLESQFTLEDAIRPLDGQKIRLFRAAQADCQWLVTLARTRMVAEGIQQRPACANAQRGMRADSRGIGTHGLALVFHTAEAQANKRVASRARRPDGKPTACIQPNHGWTK
ncbi:MAG: hypothetical protein ABFS45_10390 [Pseudomonadota bacterium]